MLKDCPVCGYDTNPIDADFCLACGAELKHESTSTSDSTTTQNSSFTFVPPSPPQTQDDEEQDFSEPDGSFSSVPSPALPPLPIPSTQPITPSAGSLPSPPFIPSPSPNVKTKARLIAKLSNAPVREFEINDGALIGIFTSEAGPVDIDLGDFPGSDTISKHHAEIFYQNGTWMIKDQSTNGTYIKPVGQTRFSARIMAPTPLNSGDEIAFAKITFVFQSS